MYIYIYIFTKTNFWCLLHNIFLHCEQTHPTIGWNLYLWLHTIDPQNSRDEDFRCRWFMRCCKCVHAVCCCALRKSQKHEIVGQFNVHWSQWNQNMARICHLGFYKKNVFSQSQQCLKCYVFRCLVFASRFPGRVAHLKKWCQALKKKKAAAAKKGAPSDAVKAAAAEVHHRSGGDGDGKGDMMMKCHLRWGVCWGDVGKKNVPTNCYTFQIGISFVLISWVRYWFWKYWKSFLKICFCRRPFLIWAVLCFPIILDACSTFALPPQYHVITFDWITSFWQITIISRFKRIMPKWCQTNLWCFNQYHLYAFNFNVMMVLLKWFWCVKSCLIQKRICCFFFSVSFRESNLVNLLLHTCACRDVEVPTYLWVASCFVRLKVASLHIFKGAWCWKKRDVLKCFISTVPWILAKTIH